MTLLKSEETLGLGDSAPDFDLKGVDNNNHSLEHFKDSKALLIVFMCNHCPYVKPKMAELIRLQEKFNGKLAVVGINSNESENYPEDSFENMIKEAKERNFNFAYLHDETQEVAKAYGAVCTPDPFLFDSERKLVYHGRLDDAMNPDDVATKKEMEEVIGALLEDKEMNFEFRPSQGCSIKWKN